MQASKRAVAVVAAIGLAAAGTAYATIPDGGGVIHGCYGMNGSLRVIDSPSSHCLRNETPLDWSARGPQGPAGPPGPQGAQGPQGPAGVVGSLDALNGIPCRGVRGKLATVRIDYGSGLEAPVSITCVTHLVANPGPVTLNVTGVTLSLGFFGERPLPVTGQLTGSVDFGGHITTPGLPATTVPFDQTQDFDGFSTVHASGSLTVSSTGLTGTIDPETGVVSVSGSLSGSVTLSATASILGVTTDLYSGTCAFGTAATPIAATFSTDPPGIPYSSADGSVTLSAPFTAPSFDGCSPAMPSAYAFLLDLFAGSGRMTLTGTTDPILKPT